MWNKNLDLSDQGSGENYINSNLMPDSQIFRFILLVRQYVHDEGKINRWVRSEADPCEGK